MEKKPATGSPSGLSLDQMSALVKNRNPLQILASKSCLKIPKPLPALHACR
jgi:hypothetical protein